MLENIDVSAANVVHMSEGFAKEMIDRLRQDQK